jgi:hypothetical protein
MNTDLLMKLASPMTAKSGTMEKRPCKNGKTEVPKSRRNPKKLQVMKKFVAKTVTFTSLVCFVAILMLCTTSCSKEKMLDGTTWAGNCETSYVYNGQMYAAKHVLTLSFVGNTATIQDKCTLSNSNGSVTGIYSEAGTFSCKQSNITMTLAGYASTGKIKGNKSMTLILNWDNAAIYDVSVVFTKR